MADHGPFHLAALQFNLGAVNTKGVSVYVGRHLLHEYLKQSIFKPDPAFIALQDKCKKKDVESIHEAMKQRPGNSGAEYKWNVSKPGKQAALLYDAKVMTYDSSENMKLGELDFFEGKGAELCKRLDGGLFCHEPSKEFIVAISYHGVNDSEAKQTEHLCELLKGLRRKYEDKDPMYLILGDFNLDVDKVRSETAHLGWEIYPRGHRTVRDIRKRQIDCVLVFSPRLSIKDIATRDFTPLPVKIEDDIYKLQTIDGHHEGNEVTFTQEDLKMAPNSHTLLEYFENHKELLSDLNHTKSVFDHDFIHFLVSNDGTLDTSTPQSILTRTPEKDQSKKRLSKNDKELADEAMRALKWLKEDTAWVEVTKKEKEQKKAFKWIEATNTKLRLYKSMTLQELLLRLRLQDK